MLLRLWEDGNRQVESGTVVYQVTWREFTKRALLTREADPTHDHDRDEDELECAREFPNVVAARRFAKSTARKRSIYGYAEVEELRAEQDEYAPAGIGEWVRVGDPEIVD